MNCTSFRKFAGAFADGELDVRHNLEALEHINMCPVCAERVEEVSRLRSALIRLWGDQAAPSRLHREVRAILQRESGSLQPDLTIDELEESFALPATGRRYRRRGAFALLSLAALLALFMAVWPGWTGPPSAQARFVDAVRDHHLDCRAWRGGDFLDREQVRVLRASASEKYAMRLAAPELSHFNYRLRNGCDCEIAGVKGMHLTYVVPESDARLSVFTTPRQDFLVTTPQPGFAKRKLFVTPDNESPAVVAWSDDRRTISVCAGMSPAALVEMIDQVVLVLDQAPSPSGMLLASARP